MTIPKELSDQEYAVVQVEDLLDLIARANRRIKAHQETNDSFSVSQWQRLKEEHTSKLLAILKEHFELPLAVFV